MSQAAPRSRPCRLRPLVALLLALLAGSAPLFAQTKAERVADVVVAVLGCPAEKVTEEARFREDLGATDTDVQELVMTLEEEFELEIPDEEAAKILTVGDALRLVENNAGDKN